MRHLINDYTPAPVPPDATSRGILGINMEFYYDENVRPRVEGYAKEARERMAREASKST